MLTIGVDVGGTNIGVGLVADDNTVVARAKRPTPGGGPDVTFAAIIDAIGEIASEEPVAAVGVGFPGPVRDGQVVRLPNIPGWDQPVDIAGSLEQLLGAPVVLGNDADVGLLGEWTAGAAQGSDHVLGVWLGTGIGGALILGGTPYDGALGAAGELGHMIVQPGGAQCGCGHRGCLEAYAGRRAMTTTVQAIADAGRPTRLFELQQELGKAQASSKVWAHALHEDDPVATEVFRAGTDALGVAIASVVNLLDVSQVVIGGGVAGRMGPKLAHRIERAAQPWLFHPDPDLAFTISALGDDAGVVGAATLARAAVPTAG